MSAAPKFTPGPWEVAYFHSLIGECADSLAVWPAAVLPATDSPANCVCVVSPIDKVTHEDHANARLIAAAPELYEALALIAGSANVHADVLRETARAALAKVQS